jgi:DNA polymerase I-like protein with 3'-5' exonuclease and polymerase domains
MVNDPQVASVYGYRNRLITCLGTFLRPWLRQAEATLTANGVATIHTNWKQVKASDFGGGDAGAATGRLSSSPNFQNIPKAMEDRGDGYVHPAFAKLPPLPLMRKYLMPDEGHVWGHRDYSQQELRVFAHYAESMTEEGVKSLAQMYRENPKLDVHGIVDKGLREEGLEFIRTFVKNFVFQTLYGGGVPAVTAALHTTDAIARRAIQALKDYLPGYDALSDDIKSMAKDEGLPLRTWGGRLYYVEEPRYVPEHGRVMSFEYKLLNYLIQGSSADCTKEAIIRYHNHPKRQARFLITVHDEINISIPKHRVKEELEILRECMESIEFDVPMLSEPKVGPRWSEAKKMEMAA